MERENVPGLFAQGVEPMLALRAFKDAFPTLNTKADTHAVVQILNQGNQGACQGHMLAQLFAICFWLATGRLELFSRAYAYYKSQVHDGIKGDNGSTLNAGVRVSREGMCLEKDFPYPAEYDPRIPDNLPLNFRLTATRPLRTVEEIDAWEDSGLPFGFGGPWNATANREVIDAYNPNAGGGGHAFTFFGQESNGTSKMINSWGKQWMQDGMSQWTKDSLRKALRHPWVVIIGFSPDAMSFPNQTPIA
jgi:hypothetical protein